MMRCRMTLTLMTVQLVVHHSDSRRIDESHEWGSATPSFCFLSKVFRIIFDVIESCCCLIELRPLKLGSFVLGILRCKGSLKAIR